VAKHDEHDRGIAELVAQLGRVAYSAGIQCGLTPAQWTALRFFSRANRFSRTTSAFAEYHATTRGTASQTVRQLVERGYLARSRSPIDGRSVRFELTGMGIAALDHDPFEDIARAVNVLPARAKASLAENLKRMLEKLADERGRRRFGTCAECRYLEREEEDRVPGGCICGFYREPIDETEAQRLCVNFASAR
jgi:DNA-binding MarR family transcriptional regulator